MKRTSLVLLVLAGLLLGWSVPSARAQATSTADKAAQAKPPAQASDKAKADQAKADKAKADKAAADKAKADKAAADKAKADQAKKPADQKAGAKDQPKAKPATVAPAPVVPATPVPAPPGYVIGPDDVLQVLYWREKDVSAEVSVRPDGMISLPLLNDVVAAGLTPDQLHDKVNELAKKYFEDPSVTIVVKTINSRRVYITGSVNKPGTYPLTAPTTVLQLIAMAGGLTEFAKENDIAVMRTENGKPMRYPFKYKDVAKGKNLKQNIELKPGDTVIVP
jgi:polysaccharide biosynthesis/export protein